MCYSSIHSYNPQHYSRYVDLCKLKANSFITQASHKVDLSELEFCMSSIIECNEIVFPCLKKSNYNHSSVIQTVKCIHHNHLPITNQNGCMHLTFRLTKIKINNSNLVIALSMKYICVPEMYTYCIYIMLETVCQN